MDEVKPVARVPTAEHREPCESRGSRTVLGAPGGEIPPGDSTIASFRCAAKLVAYWTNNGQKAALGLDLSTAIVESPGGISPPGAPRSVREPLDSHGSRCSAVGTRGQQLYLVHGLLLLPVGFSWPVASVEQCSPFAPAPLQNLHRYYELLRPYAPHRYSDPHCLSRL